MKNIIKTVILATSLITSSHAVSIENLKQNIVDAVKVSKIEKKEYKVVFNKTKIKASNALIKANLSKTNLKNILDTNKSEILFVVPAEVKIKENVKERLSHFPTDANSLAEFCKENSKKQVLPLGSDAQFESFDVEYTDNQDVGTKVSRVFVRYKRLFKGNKVRNNLSYAYVIYDGDGALSGFEAKWPEFELVNDNEKEDITSPEESLSYLISDLENPLSTDTQYKIQVNPISANVLGFENAWMPVEDNGNLIITPVHTFYSDVTLDSGDKIHKLTDYPILRKYLK